MSMWSQWSACSVSCASGSQSRTRSVVTDTKYNGKACPNDFGYQSCGTQSCPIDCVVSGFVAWSTCTELCGGGVQKRKRSVITIAQNGGKPCDPINVEQNCNTHPC